MCQFQSYFLLIVEDVWYRQKNYFNSLSPGFLYGFRNLKILFYFYVINITYFWFRAAVPKEINIFLAKRKVLIVILLLIYTIGIYVTLIKSTKFSHNHFQEFIKYQGDALSRDSQTFCKCNVVIIFVKQISKFSF